MGPAFVPHISFVWRAIIPTQKLHPAFLIAPDQLKEVSTFNFNFNGVISFMANCLARGNP